MHTAAVTPIDLGDFLSGTWEAFGDGFELACGPDAPLRWAESAPDCPGGNDALGFYFRGVAVNAISPRKFLGAYEL